MRRLKLMRRVQVERMQSPERSLPGDPCGHELPPTFPGDEPQRCAGELVVYHSHAEAGMRIRYLECSCCRHKPADNKWVVPIQGL